MMRIDRDEKGRIHGKYVEIYGRRGSLMYNTKGEPLSIHVFMNTLLKFEGVVYQARCIQWGEKEYELLVNADREKLNVEELLAAYRHYLGEDAEIRYIIRYFLFHKAYFLPFHLFSQTINLPEIQE